MRGGKDNEKTRTKAKDSIQNGKQKVKSCHFSRPKNVLIRYTGEKRRQGGGSPGQILILTLNKCKIPVLQYVSNLTNWLNKV
jgi:hypothetical protein